MHLKTPSSNVPIFLRNLTKNWIQHPSLKRRKEEKERQNKTKQNKTNKIKLNKTKRNKTKQNKTGIGHVQQRLHNDFEVGFDKYTTQHSGLLGTHYMARYYSYNLITIVRIIQKL